MSISRHKKYRKRRKQRETNRIYEYGAHGELLSTVPLSPAEAEEMIAFFEMEESRIEKEEALIR